MQLLMYDCVFVVLFPAGKKKKLQKSKNVASGSSRSSTQSETAASGPELVGQSTKLKTFSLDTGLLLETYL